MTIKDKIIFALLTIMTLGIYPLMLKSKAKQARPASSTLSTAKKVSVNIDNLKAALGGEENILGVEYTHTKIKVTIQSKEKVIVDKIQDLKGVSGVFATSKTITIIVGNQAKLISTML